MIKTTQKIIKLGGISSEGSEAGIVISPDGLCFTLCACTHGYAMGNIIVTEKYPVAMRGRNPDNPTSRKSGIYLEQRLELNHDGLCNTLTTVQKDTMVLEKYIKENEK